MTIAAIAQPATCPRCGARLRPQDATWTNGPSGYLPVLRWAHRRPDNRRKCHVDSGLPIGYSSPGMPPGVASVKIPA